MTGKAHGTSSSNPSAPYELSLTPPALADCRSRLTGSPDQPAVADEDCGYAGEGKEVFGFALVPPMEPAATRQPGHGSLNHPPMPAQPL
jgi:hypothetical protein